MIIDYILVKSGCKMVNRWIKSSNGVALGLYSHHKECALFIFFRGYVFAFVPSPVYIRPRWTNINKTPALELQQWCFCALFSRGLNLLINENG